MDFYGYVKNLNVTALLKKGVNIPKGTPMRVIDLPMSDGLRVGDAIERCGGIMAKEQVKAYFESQGCGGLQFNKETQILAPEDLLVVKRAQLINGAMAPKAVVESVWRPDRAILLEEVGDCYAFANPSILFDYQGGFAVVDVNDLAEITDLKLRILKAKKKKAKSKENSDLTDAIQYAMDSSDQNETAELLGQMLAEIQAKRTKTP